MKRAVLEGDSLNVIKGLMEEERLVVPTGLLIEDAKNLSHCFDELLSSHTKSECNVLTYSLVRYVVGISGFLV